MDRPNFIDLYERTRVPLGRYLMRLCGNRAQAEELMQEAYLRLFKLPESARLEEPRAYLFRIASNLAADEHRKRQRRQAWSWLGFTGEPTSTVQDSSEYAAVFDKLRLRDKMLLWLAYVEGCSHAEIAEILLLRPASVRVLLSRARERLQTLCTDQEEEASRARAT